MAVVTRDPHEYPDLAVRQHGQDFGIAVYACLHNPKPAYPPLLRRTPYEKVAEIMAAAACPDFTRIGFATEPDR